MKYKLKVPRTIAEVQHHAEHFFHMTYLGLVGWEAHGFYHFAAIALFLVTAAGVFIVQEAQNVAEQI